MVWIWFYIKEKKVWENVLGLHNQIFNFGLIKIKKIKKKSGFGWIYIEAPNQPGQVTLFHPLFWEMVLSRFPNRQLEIMIDVYLIALLYDLELGFHILVSLINQIMVVFFGQVCLVHLSYFSHVFDLFVQLSTFQK